MVSSNKKRRGKQRKAAKNREAAAAAQPTNTGTNEVNGIGTEFEQFWGDDQRYRKAFNTLPPEKIINDIKRGDYTATEMASELSSTDEADIVCRDRLINAGIVPVILELLDRCREELPFPNVFPNQWMSMLCVFGDPSTDVQYAKSMGPIIQCLSDDRKRQFFQSNMFWHFSIPDFLTMASNVIQTEAALKIMLTYEGFLDMVIRCLFYKSDRADIVQEVKDLSFFALGDAFPSIIKSSCEIITSIVHSLVDFGPQCLSYDDMKWKSAEGKELVNKMGKTFIMSSCNDNQDCKVLLVEGLLRTLPQFPSMVSKDSVFHLLMIFTKAGCVDEQVISIAIEYGNNNVTDYDDAFYITRLIYHMLMPRTDVEIPHADGRSTIETRHLPGDSKFASAIKLGLIQTCLKLLIEFGNDPDERRMDVTIQHILFGANEVALLKRTSKAIAGEIHSITKQLEILSNMQTTNDVLIGIVVSVKSMISINANIGDTSNNATTKKTVLCNNCGKQLEKVNAKQCAACNAVSYCSKECQVSDWRSGHKKQCQVLVRNKQAKLIDPSTVSNVGRNILMNNIISSLLQATIKGVSLVDECVVVLNITKAPPKMTVHQSADFLSFFTNTPGGGGEFVGGSEQIALNRSNGCLTCCYASRGKSMEYAWLLDSLSPSRTRNGSWNDAQAFVNSQYQELIDKCKDDEDYRNSTLDKLSKATRTNPGDPLLS